jgi:hypothetical protein
MTDMASGCVRESTSKTNAALIKKTNEKRWESLRQESAKTVEDLPEEDRRTNMNKAYQNEDLNPLRPYSPFCQHFIKMPPPGLYALSSFFRASSIMISADVSSMDFRETSITGQLIRAKNRRASCSSVLTHSGSV